MNRFRHENAPYLRLAAWIAGLTLALAACAAPPPPPQPYYHYGWYYY